MKHVVPSACLAAAFAVGLSAQTPSPAPEAQASSPKSVTVTGCLKAGDEPGTFALSNIKAADKAPSAASASPTAGTTGATGTTGSAGASTIPKELENATVKLTGSPSGVKMDDHVGHTVRVSGTVNAAAPSGGAAAGAAGAPAAAPSAGKAQPSLDVSSLSMVSGSCSM